MTRHIGDEFVVVTQNIWGGGPRWDRRRHALAHDLKTLHPDVVGLQEVTARTPSGEGSQAHELAAMVGGYDTFFAAGRVKPSGECEGVALLCRRDVREHSVESLTLDTEDFLESQNQRVVLCGMLELPEGPVDVFVTHLSLSKRARARTIMELLAFVGRERARSHSVAAVLVGDFNGTPSEPAIAALEGSSDWPEGGWADVWRVAQGPHACGATWPAIAPFRRIDYVFVQPRDGWEIRACEVGARSGSDHRAVVARLRLRVR